MDREKGKPHRSYSIKRNRGTDRSREREREREK